MRGEATAGALTRGAPVRRALIRAMLAFGVLACGACLLAPVVGSTSISLTRVFDPSIAYADNVDAQIFFVARLPRVLAAAFVGSALATAGVVFQALLRNPLATPFTLGVSAGAALGAMLAITFSGALSAAQVVSVPVASFAGSMAAVAIVYALATARHRGFSTNVMLLAGVNASLFYLMPYRRTTAAGAPAYARRSARVIAAASIVLWLSVIIAGRLLTFYRPAPCEPGEAGVLAECIPGYYR